MLTAGPTPAAVAIVILHATMIRRVAELLTVVEIVTRLIGPLIILIHDGLALAAIIALVQKRILLALLQLVLNLQFVLHNLLLGF